MSKLTSIFRKKPSKKGWLIILSTILIVGAGLGYYLFTYNKHVDQNAVTSQTEEAMEKGDYQSAKDVSLNAYNNESDKLKKADYAKQVGLSYLSQNNFDNAREWYQKALSIYASVKDQSKVDPDNKKFIENELEYIKQAEGYKETKPRDGPENAL